MNLRTRKIATAALISFAVTAASPARAETFGLVVGINDYKHLSKLDGAVADAKDVEAALKASGAKNITTLLDGAATREAILDAWRTILKTARAGDTVVFSYAGHGGQERERVRGNEDDGLDEVFLLAGFNEDATGNGERIVDDELHQLFIAARHLKVVFVADSCHSGTMTRSFDDRAGKLRTRLASYGEIVNDQLPAPDPKAAAINPELLDNVVFFGAVQDHELALEYAIDGVTRGALSWSFARALRGHADQNGDKVINTRELERYLLEKVRTVTEGRQFPQMVPRGRPTEIAFRVTQPASAAAGQQDALVKPLNLHVAGTNDAPGLAANLRDVRLVAAGQADLTWDRKNGEVVSASGDVVARLGADAAPGRVQPLVDKWLLLRDLGELAEQQPLNLRIDAGNGTHHAGTELKILLDGHTGGNLTLVNLAVDGTVQFLVPWPASPNRNYHGPVEPGRTFSFKLKVSPPFGADHLVALTSPQPMSALHKEILSLDGKKAAGLLRSVIATHLKGAAYQLGSVGLFTAP